MVALAPEPAAGEMVLLVEVVIDLYNSIVAVTGRCDGAEEIVRSPRQAADQVSWPEPVRADQFCRQRALWNAVGIRFSKLRK